jgi:hypothetical protein
MLAVGAVVLPGKTGRALKHAGNLERKVAFINIHLTQFSHSHYD